MLSGLSVRPQIKYEYKRSGSKKSSKKPNDKAPQEDEEWGAPVYIVFSSTFAFLFVAWLLGWYSAMWWRWQPRTSSSPYLRWKTISLSIKWRMRLRSKKQEYVPRADTNLAAKQREEKAFCDMARPILSIQRVQIMDLMQRLLSIKQETSVEAYWERFEQLQLHLENILEDVPIVVFVHRLDA